MIVHVICTHNAFQLRLAHKQNVCMRNRLHSWCRQYKAYTNVSHVSDANGPHLFIVIVYVNELDSGHPLPESYTCPYGQRSPKSIALLCIYMHIHIHIHMPIQYTCTCTMSVHIHIHTYTMNIHIHMHATLHTMSCLNHFRQCDVKECVSLGVSPCYPIMLVLCSNLDVGFLATPPRHVSIHCGLSKLPIQSPIGT